MTPNTGSGGNTGSSDSSGNASCSNNANRVDFNVRNTHHCYSVACESNLNYIKATNTTTAVYQQYHCNCQKPPFHGRE